jgi:hypothetical protein
MGLSNNSDLQRKLAVARVAMLHAERLRDENMRTASQGKYLELVAAAANAGVEYRLILAQMDQHADPTQTHS